MAVKRLDGEKTREARLKRADGRCESVGAHGSTGPGAFRMKESRAGRLAPLSAKPSAGRPAETGWYRVFNAPEP